MTESVKTGQNVDVVKDVKSALKEGRSFLKT
jgi:hypothetical protein